MLIPFFYKKKKKKFCSLAPILALCAGHPHSQKVECPLSHRGGHSHWKGVWGCAAVMTPFFQASRRSLAHQFTLNAPLLCPLFSIFRKFLHFKPCFGQNSSSLDLNFSQFSFLRPPFFQENPLPRPYIFKPAWHTPTKKKSWVPPRAVTPLGHHIYVTVNSW